MKIIRRKFLDYTIVNSGNSDSLVITKPEGQLYECNLGNFKELDSAKRACILYFMIARPHVFATTVFYRTIGIGGQTSEFSLFKHQCEKENIEVPKELIEENYVMWIKENTTCTKYAMTFKGKLIGFDKAQFEKEK